MIKTVIFIRRHAFYPIHFFAASLFSLSRFRSLPASSSVCSIIPSFSYVVFIFALRRGVCFVVMLVCFFDICCHRKYVYCEFYDFRNAANNNRIRFLCRSLMYICMCGGSVMYLFAMKLFAWAENGAKDEFGWLVEIYLHTCIGIQIFVLFFSPSTSSTACAVIINSKYFVFVEHTPVGHCSFSISRYKMHAFMSFCSMFHYCHILYLWFTAISINCLSNNVSTWKAPKS